MIRINAGCGRTPTAGWRNYDNSISVRLARRPFLFFLARKLKLLGKEQEEFVLAAIKHKIICANAAKRIPEADNSVEVLYTSHMIEHLDPEEAALFLKEGRRVMAHGGTIRICVPDLKKLAALYMKAGDSDEFVRSLALAVTKPKGFIERLKYLAAGARNHRWMYDGKSLCGLLSSVGFIDPQVVEAGRTGISEPGDLDLFERSGESVYVEAKNP